MGVMMSLGTFIRNRRKCMRMTQEQLAEKMNVSKSAIAKWENDGGIPERNNLYCLAQILGVSINDLYHIIQSPSYQKVDLEVNITAEVIATLESYGYKVIRPSRENKEDEE